MTTFTIWQPLLISGLLALVVLWYIWRSLFGDRARHGPRCLSCGHPFTKDQDLTCVECGWIARRERDLTRPRRHWIQATLGLLVLLLGAWILRMQSTGESPVRYVPDSFLVRLFPMVPGDGVLQDEVARRLNDDELSTTSLETLVRRLLAGDDTAPPTGLKWQVRYGGLLDQWRQAYASPGNPLTAALLELSAAATLETAAWWDSDEPVPATLTLRDWWPLGTEAVAELRWASSPEEPPIHAVGYRNDASIERRHHLVLPPAETWPDPPVVEIAFRAPSLVRLAGESLETPTAATPDAPAAISRVELTPPIGGGSQPLEPWPGNDAATAAIQAMFEPGIQRWVDAETRPYAMRFNPRHLADDEFGDVLFGFVVEVIERAPTRPPQIHRRTRIWAVGGSPETIGRRIGWDISEEATEALDGAFDPESDHTWFIRVTGDEDVAGLARGLLADRKSVDGYGRWWSGSTTFQLNRATSDGEPFRRMWFDPGGVQPPSPRPRP